MKIQKKYHRFKKKNNSVKIFDKFAKYYDRIYHDKDYEKECQFVISNLKKHGTHHIKKILDLGCGTGGHCIIMAKNGFSITGLDKSDLALQIAKKKNKTLKLKCNFVKQDMTDFYFNEKFDACMSMFCSFCYLNNKKQIMKTLHCIKNNLKSGGLFIFDFWNGKAVITERPTTKVKIINDGNDRIIRIATPQLNMAKKTCSIEYHCLVIKKNSIIDEFKEVHKIRYYFQEELTKYFKEAGFEILKILPMNKTSSKGNKSYLKNWYLFAIVRKKGE